MLAYTGIEAASNLAPDLRYEPKDLRRIISTGALVVPLIYAGMAAIALMAVPVVAGPDGPQTALGERYVEAPVLGVASAYDPSWLSDLMRWMVALVAAPVLFIAAYTSMLGVSRHIYTLAINRQIPSWLGKLGTVHETPYVAIVVSGLIAIGLVLPTDVELLAGIYAFGAMLAISIAHLSIIRLRITEPERPRPYVPPGSVRWGRWAAGAGDPRRRAEHRRVRQRARLPRAGSLGGRRLDGVRADLLSRLPRPDREHQPHQAGLGDRARP